MAGRAGCETLSGVRRCGLGAVASPARGVGMGYPRSRTEVEPQARDAAVLVAPSTDVSGDC